MMDFVVVWMVGSIVGSVSDPMPDCQFDVVGSVDEMVADQESVQLVVFAWDATMVQAKTLNQSK